MNLTLLLADLATPTPNSPLLVSPALTGASGAAAQGTDGFLIFTLVVVTLFLGGTLLWLLIGLARNPAWSIADAVSEEAGNQPDPLPPTVKPVMVASASRLIAVLGLIVLIGMSIGVGYAIIWSIFIHQQLQLQGLLSYFYGMAALFAPYAVNQLREAFSAFAQAPTQTPTPATATGPAAAPGPAAATGPAQPQAPPAQKPALQPSVQLPVLKQPVQPGSQN